LHKNINKYGDISFFFSFYIIDGKWKKSDSSYFKKTIISFNLGSYLAGFFEGNGHISFFNKYSQNPTFNITFNIKDIQLAKSYFI
jgi:hypothetical protein